MFCLSVTAPLAKPRPPRLGSAPLVLMSTTAKAPSKKAASKNGASLHREHSKLVVDGYERAASRAMLHAVGFAREDFKKSQVGIASTWSMVTPCKSNSFWFQPHTILRPARPCDT